MSEVVLIVVVGTALILGLGLFIAFMVLYYQKRKLEFHKNLKELSETYQRELLKAQIEIQEQTFLFISQEIHDNVGQTLSLARLNMNVLETSVNSEVVVAKVVYSKELLDQAIEDLRDLSKRLNSNFTKKQRLTDLLEFQLGLIQKTGVIDTCFHVEGEEHSFDPEKKLIIFRIAQESISNILKHAHATNLSASVKFINNRLILAIADNGKGFEVDKQPNGKGFSVGTGTCNMEFRAKLIGGTFQIISELGKGTQTILNVPLN